MNDEVRAAIGIHHQARINEREAVVRFLRLHGEDDLADCIFRGDHVSGEIIQF